MAPGLTSQLSCHPRAGLPACQPCSPPRACRWAGGITQDAEVEVESPMQAGGASPMRLACSGAAVVTQGCRVAMARHLARIRATDTLSTPPVMRESVGRGTLAGALDPFYRVNARGVIGPGRGDRVCSPDSGAGTPVRPLPPWA